MLLEQDSDTKSNHIAAIMAYHLIGGLVLFPWQTIGLLRSAERHYSQYTRPVALYSVQAVILISLTLLVSHFAGLVQTLSIAQIFVELKSKTSPPQNRIQLTDIGKQLVIQGTLDYGITESDSLLL